MGKSVLITGLAIGKSKGYCSCNNIDFRVLLDTPSTLLWTDKIVVTETEYKIIQNMDSGDAYDRTVFLLFSKLADEGMVEVIDDTLISDSKAKEIKDKLIEDLELMSDVIKENTDERCPERFSVNDANYCIPSLWSLYAAEYLSFTTGNTFALDKDDALYLHELFRRKGEEIHPGRNIAIDEVLMMYLPDLPLTHPFIYDSAAGRCESCGRLVGCKDSFLSTTETQINHILTCRNYDEIRQLCEVLDQIVAYKDIEGQEYTAVDIKREVEEKARQIQNKINSIFKVIDRWDSMSSSLLVGMSILAFCNHPILAGIGTSLITAKDLAKQQAEKYRDNNKWVDYVTRHLVCRH